MQCCWSGCVLHAKSAVVEKVVVPCLSSALEHESEEVRVVAVRCVGYIPKETVSPELAQIMLRSQHQTVRTMGIGILPHMSNDRVPPHLMNVVLCHNDPLMRTAGFRYLCRASHAGSPRELAAFWSAHVATKQPGSGQQSTMQDRINTDLVKMALNHADEVVREAAIQYLGRLSREQLPPELVRYTISHPSLAVRLAGAQCLRRLPQEKCPRDLQQTCFWDVSPASGAEARQKARSF